MSIEHTSKFRFLNLSLLADIQYLAVVRWLMTHSVMRRGKLCENKSDEKNFKTNLMICQSSSNNSASNNAGRLEQADSNLV